VPLFAGEELWALICSVATRITPQLAGWFATATIVVADERERDRIAKHTVPASDSRSSARAATTTVAAGIPRHQRSQSSVPHVRRLPLSRAAGGAGHDPSWLCHASCMALWPARGVSGADLHSALSVVHNGAVNILAVGHEASTVISSYLSWCTDATRILRLSLRPADLRNLVLTDTYWAAQSNPSPTKHLLAAVHNEVAARKDELQTALKELDQQLRVWSVSCSSGGMAFVVPDTNVLLEYPEPFDQLDWHGLLSVNVRSMTDIRVVIPLLVIDELDDAKSDRVRSRARQALKVLYAFFGDNVDGPRLMQPEAHLKGRVDVQVLMDPAGHARLPRADDELIDRAAALGSFRGYPVEFVTYDTGAALRARAAGLSPLRLERPDRGRAQ